MLDRDENKCEECHKEGETILCQIDQSALYPDFVRSPTYYLYLCEACKVKLNGL